MKIIMASDHAGFSYKTIRYLRRLEKIVALEKKNMREERS
jgi:hypothetical protein